MSINIRLSLKSAISTPHKVLTPLCPSNVSGVLLP